MPSDVLSIKLNRGGYAMWSFNKILCLKWMDSEDVHFLSAKNKSVNIKGTGKLQRKHDLQSREEVRKPECCLECQRGMKGVDLQDQITSLFPIIRHTVKGYHKIFFYLLDICLSSSYVVLCKFTKRRCLSLTSE
jgi:hypothetical protein